MKVQPGSYFIHILNGEELIVPLPRRELSE